MENDATPPPVTILRVSFLRQWLKQHIADPVRWKHIVTLFFERFQTLPGFEREEDLMVMGIPDGDSPEASHYVKKIFTGFLNGLARVNFGNESEDVVELLGQIYDSVEEVGGEKVEVVIWDNDQACLMVGAILLVLGQPHDHPSGDKFSSWCVRTQRPVLLQLLSACQLMLEILAQEDLDAEEREEPLE